MAKLKSDPLIFHEYSNKKKSDILGQILEQIDLVGKDDLDAIGSGVLSVLKNNCLIFQDNILVTR